MDNQRLIDSLTDAEREALCAFLIQSDIKSIAREIGISPSAVDKRLAAARRKLGVSRSLDAALLLAQADGAPTGIVVQVGHSATGHDPEQPQPRPLSEDGIGYRPTLFPTEGRPWNTLSAWQRLLVIVSSALILAVSTVALVAVGEAVSRIVRAR